MKSTQVARVALRRNNDRLKKYHVYQLTENAVFEVMAKDKDDAISKARKANPGYFNAFDNACDSDFVFLTIAEEAGRRKMIKT